MTALYDKAESLTPADFAIAEEYLSKPLRQATIWERKAIKVREKMRAPAI